MSRDKTAKFVETVVLEMNNYHGGPPRSLGNKYELSEPYVDEYHEHSFESVVIWLNLPADEWENHVIGFDKDGSFYVLEYCDRDDSDEECLAQLGYKLEE